MPLDTEILTSAFFVLLRLRVLLFGEIKRYKSPIRIRIDNPEEVLKFEVNKAKKFFGQHAQTAKPSETLVLTNI